VVVVREKKMWPLQVGHCIDSAENACDYLWPSEMSGFLKLQCQQ